MSIKSRNVLTVMAMLAMTSAAACKMSVADLMKPGGGGGSSAGGDGDAEPEAGAGDGGDGDDDEVATSDDDEDSDDDDGYGQASLTTNTIRNVVAFEAAAGAPRMKATKPTWCDVYPAGTVDSWKADSATSSLEQIKEKGWWWDASRTVMLALCSSPDDVKVQEQTGHFLQLWANQTGLAGKDLTALLRTVAVEDAYEATRDQSCAQFPIDEEGSAQEKAFGGATRMMLGCSYPGLPFFTGPSNVVDLSWHYDRGVEPPSESLRSFVVLECLAAPGAAAIEPRALAQYAICGHDARALDAKALEQEIASYGDFAKLILRAQHARARLTAAAYEAAARAQARQDADWQTVLFDAPEQGWKAWTAGFATSKKAFEAAMAYEAIHDGPSRKAAKGCWDRAWDNLTAHVAAQRPKTAREVRGAMTDSFGAVILAHATLCADGEGDDYVHSQLKRLYSAARPARGPRYAAYFAVVDALNQILADRDRFAIELDWFRGGFYTRGSPMLVSVENLDSIDLTNEDPGGVVKSVKKVDDGVLVEFKTEKWKAATLSCKSTGRIIMWGANGDPVWEQDCKSGPAEWVESTHDPMWVPASFAAGLAPGVFVRPSPSGSWHPGTSAGTAIPVEVWANKDMKTLVAHVGMAL